MLMRKGSLCEIWDVQQHASLQTVAISHLAYGNPPQLVLGRFLLGTEYGFQHPINVKVNFWSVKLGSAAGSGLLDNSQYAALAAVQCISPCGCKLALAELKKVSPSLLFTSSRVSLIQLY